MNRRFVLVGGVMAMLATVSADLVACGDKFLRVGRSARFRRYSAAYPASVLIYRPLNSTKKGIQEFEKLLKRGGHRFVTVANGTDVTRALAAGQYDLVIADYSDARRISNDLVSVSSRAALLPILYKPTKPVEREATQLYAHIIKPHTMTKYDALAEIDGLMELSRNRAPVIASR
jgi:CheY-like chemotaxis protein